MKTTELKTLQLVLGLRLRELRTRMKWAQEKAALQLKMHRAYYGAIERGEKNLTLATLIRLSYLYEVKISDFFKWSEDRGLE